MLSLTVLPLHSAWAIKTLADCPVGAPSDTINHSQTTLGFETLLVCPFDGNDGGHHFITRTYKITNNTNKAWSGYIFDVDLDGTSSLGFSFGWDAGYPTSLAPTGSVSFNNDLARVTFSSPLLVSQTLMIDLVFGEYNSGTATVRGAAIPEPSAILLILAGFAFLASQRFRWRDSLMTARIGR
ncbi:MAG: hypothetical protein EXR70_08000 [Deltaproteobacteria bacterium]|nr:hypothetical protein [Deltaproteobacteria bacterium]